MVQGDVAIVDIERANKQEGEVIDLERCEHFNAQDALDEKNNELVQTALAVERLNRARQAHGLLEKYISVQ